MKKNEALEGLRGVACLAVVSSHFLYVAFPYLARVRDASISQYPPKWQWESWFSLPPFNLFYNGDFAVIVFFVLSGYVLTKKFWETGERRILVAGAIKRYPRLIIPAGASVFFALLLMRTGLMRSHLVPDWSIAGWARDTYNQAPSIKAALHAAVIGVPFLGDTATLKWNSPLWTMKVELWCSIALFAAFFFGGKYKTVGVLLYVLWAAWGGIAGVYAMPFVFGAMLNWASNWLPARPRLSAMLFFLGCMMGCVSMVPAFDAVRAAIVLPWAYFGHAMDGMRVWYCLGAACMIAGVIGSARIATVLGGRIGRFLGHISFSAYLLHWPIVFSFGMWAMNAYTQWGMPYLFASWVAYVSTVALVIIVAAIFHRWVDNPAMALSNKLAATLVGKARQSNSSDSMQVKGAA